MTTPVVSGSIDWDSWTPGSIPAARQAAKLDELIATAVGRNSQWSDRASARGSLLASIEDHRLDRLSIAVTDAVARGDSADTLARTLRGVLDDTRWAEMVATTEMARAMTAASIESYRTSGVVDAYSILTANDVRVCQDCQTNQDDGPYPLDTDPPGGMCPSHPECRCAVVADTMPLTDAQAMGYTPGISSGALDDEALTEETDLEEEALAEPAVEVVQHDTTGSTREFQPPSAADLAAQGAHLRAGRETTGQTPTVIPEAADLSRPSEDDLAARIAELPPGVADLRLGPDAGLGQLRVGRRRRRRNKAVSVEGEDGEGDE